MNETMVEKGSPAPDFTLAADDGSEVTLSKLRGKKVLIYFYPKDDTPGCTKESIAFTGQLAQFEKAGTTVVGISRDSCASHAKFREKYTLKHTLGADEDGKAVNAYGVWVEKNLYGNKTMGIERTTFLIDEKGVVRKVWRKVKVDGHVDEVLEAARGLH